MATRLLALVAVACALVSGAAPALTVDELIAKHVEARGGRANMAAIRSVQYTGKLEVSGEFNAEFAVVRRIERPGRIRSEATLQGLVSVRAWDGREGWAISPLFGRKDPQKIARDECKDLIDMADLDGPLVDRERKGYRVEYLGTEDLEGTDAHKLRVTAKDGDVQYVYLDPDYFLVIRILYQRSVRGAQVDTETDFGNYGKVAGVYFPYAIETGPKGAAKTQKLTIDKLEVNVPMDDALFRFPAGAK